METRVQKHKEYRASMIKEGSEKRFGVDKFATSTLPLSEVMKEEKSSEDTLAEFKKEKNKKYLILILICIALLAAIAGLIVFGVLAFRR